MDDAAPADRSDSADAIPTDLLRTRPLGRFPPATEQAYRSWAVADALPLVQLIGWLSVLIWLTAPAYPAVLFDREAPIEAWVVCWVNTIVLVVTLLIARHRPQIWHAAAVLTLVTLDSLLLIEWMDVRSGAWIMIGQTVFYSYLAPVMHFPFRTTCVVQALIVPTATVWAILVDQRDGAWDTGMNFQLWLLGATSVFALAMTLLSENNTRQRYADERLLDHQRNLLVESRALIRRYAPPAVADRLEHGDHTVDHSQRRRVTILFADVVGFTELADRLDPEALAEIVNDYLGSVAQIVDAHGGTLNEFAGDGVMAIFGAPDEMEPRDEVLAALAAARELQRSLPEWSRRWYPLGIDQDLQARVGINTGVVSVGTFGSAVRATYTGIGLQTNIAARIQAQCSPGSVLLSKTSWHLVSDGVSCQPRGGVDVKGVHFPIAMYEPAATS